MAKKKKLKVKDFELTQVREAIYRGKPIEELKALDVRESAKFLPSRSRRSVLRNFDTIEKFIKRCETLSSRKKKIKTHLRDIVIVPKLVGLTIAVHSGKNFQDVPISHEMIGHRLGEFVQTRKKVAHSAAGIGATKSSRAQKK
jgi:small subunit ribosomal protein S19